MASPNPDHYLVQWYSLTWVYNGSVSPIRAPGVASPASAVAVVQDLRLQVAQAVFLTLREDLVPALI